MRISVSLLNFGPGVRLDARAGREDWRPL